MTKKYIINIMEFKKTESYRYFKSLCLWSLLSDIIFVLSFLLSWAYTLKNPNWMQIGWIIPLFTKAFLILIFCVANSHFAYTLYLERIKKEKVFLLKIIKDTEYIFNKLFKNFFISNLIIILSIISYIINYY